jgi:endonuclease YncB( thermonuclease family)
MGHGGALLMYDYRARVVRWKDGDTVVLHVDQGYGNWTEQPHRVVGLFAPEKRNPGGPEALAAAQELAPVDSMVYIDTRKPSVLDLWHWTQQGRTFERWLAVIYIGDGRENFADKMIEKGMGTRYA